MEEVIRLHVDDNSISYHGRRLIKNNYRSIEQTKEKYGKIISFPPNKLNNYNSTDKYELNKTFRLILNVGLGTEAINETNKYMMLAAYTLNGDTKKVKEAYDSLVKDTECSLETNVAYQIYERLKGKIKNVRRWINRVELLNELEEVYKVLANNYNNKEIKEAKQFVEGIKKGIKTIYFKKYSELEEHIKGMLSADLKKVYNSLRRTLYQNNIGHYLNKIVETKNEIDGFNMKTSSCKTEEAKKVDAKDKGDGNGPHFKLSGLSTLLEIGSRMLALRKYALYYKTKKEKVDLEYVRKGVDKDYKKILHEVTTRFMSHESKELLDVLYDSIMEGDNSKFEKIVKEIFRKINKSNKNESDMLKGILYGLDVLMLEGDRFKRDDLFLSFYIESGALTENIIEELKGSKIKDVYNTIVEDTYKDLNLKFYEEFSELFYYLTKYKLETRKKSQQIKDFADSVLNLYNGVEKPPIIPKKVAKWIGIAGLALSIAAGGWIGYKLSNNNVQDNKIYPTVNATINATEKDNRMQSISQNASKNESVQEVIKQEQNQKQKKSGILDSLKGLYGKIIWGNIEHTNGWAIGSGENRFYKDTNGEPHHPLLDNSDGFEKVEYVKTDTYEGIRGITKDGKKVWLASTRLNKDIEEGVNKEAQKKDHINKNNERKGEGLQPTWAYKLLQLNIYKHKAKNPFSYMP